MWKETLQSQLVLSYISLIILMQNYFKRKFQEWTKNLEPSGLSDFVMKIIQNIIS